MASDELRASVLGADIGASGLRIARLDAAGSYRILDDFDHQGKMKTIGEHLRNAIEHGVREYGSVVLAMTGTLSDVWLQPLGINRCSMIGCHVAGAEAGTRTVIDMGASGARLIDLSGKSPKSKTAGRCAAGTGSFLSEQASQMGLDFKGFMDSATQTAVSAPIGGRCSVFAKSDRVTCGARGFSLQEITRGLHQAVARTFAANIVKGANLAEPIAMHGRLANDPVLLTSLESALELEPGTIRVPVDAAARSAIGAAMLGREDAQHGFKRSLSILVTPDTLDDILDRIKHATETDLTESDVSQNEKTPALRVGFSIPEDPPLPEWGDAVRDVILGIDIGSRSTNILALDVNSSEILYTDYLNTAGQPLRVALGGLKAFKEAVGDRVRVLAVGTTGSSRDFIRRSIRGDFSIDEITAQAHGSAFHADKAGKKIAAVFEIGGQDSKFIVLNDGVITQFGMNKICSAGTGTFLEEIAKPLNVDYRGEFQQRAMRSIHPSPITARCTVFMRSECQDALRRGDSIDNILAGVAVAIVNNYLDTFPDARPLIGRLSTSAHADEFIALQGGTFLNHSIIAAFEKVLDFHRFYIPEYCSQTGALGIALITRTWLDAKKAEQPGYTTAFDLNTLGDHQPEQSSFECKHCPNHCIVSKVTIIEPDGAKRFVFTGDTCERYSSGGERKSGAGDIPALLEKRNGLVFGDVSITRVAQR